MATFIVTVTFIFIGPASAQNSVVVVPLFDDCAICLPAPVEKTGQNLCYFEDGITDGTCACGVSNCPSGQDGDLQRGVPYPNPRFKDNGNGTVTDSLTSLIWLKNADCPNAERTWPQAFNDIDDLNTSGTMNGNDCNDTSKGGGHQTDWRLANIKELYSLIDLGQVEPAIPAGHPFANLRTQGNYWSSTTKVDENTNAWDVSIWNGNTSSKRNKVNDDIYVWPVRGGN